MLEQLAKWGMVGLMAFAALMTIMAVNKPRQPLTGGVAATTVAMNALWITAIVIWWD
jgi:hypothetical protein